MRILLKVQNILAFDFLSNEFSFLMSGLLYYLVFTANLSL